MIAAGVRIQNNSWGYENQNTGDKQVWIDPAVTDGFVNVYRDLVLNNNVLVIFASGN